MKKALLVHGCHLQAAGWEDIVWGDPQVQRLGRASKALQMSANREIDLMYWGTGASEKDGRKEAQYTFDYAVTHASQLPDYKGHDVYEVESLLKSKSFIDTETQNTTQEVARAMRVCEERGIHDLILLSSPTHIARCMQEAEKIRAESNAKGIEIFSTASDTCFQNSTPADVVIIEPPHRGDMPKWQTYRYARAMFGILRDGDERFAQFLGELGDLLRGYGAQVSWQPRG